VGSDLLIKLARIIAVSLIIISFSANAVDQRDLYQVSVLVEDQSQQQRQVAAQKAMKVVLLRVAGIDSVMQSAAAKAAVAKASTYVQGFSYTAAEDEGYDVRLAFDAASINRLITDNALPQWPLPRPKPLIWWVSDVGAGKQMVSLSELVDDPQLLLDASLGRGFEFSSPLLDLDDRLALGANALWYNEIDRIRDASARYQSRYAVVVRLAKVSSGWRVTFTLVTPSGQSSKDLRVTDISMMFDELAAFTANEIAAKTAIRSVVQSTEQSSRRVVIAGVLGFEDYAAVVEYLSQLTGVKHASIVQVDGDRLHFDVQLSGEYERVQALIDAQGRLKLQSSADPFADELNYYWLPARD